MNSNIDPKGQTPLVPQETQAPQRKGLLELLPQYILAGTGIVFAAGFLVVLAFLDRFGIREAGTDFWKARYIHIGIICVAFPFIFNATVLSLLHLVFHGKFNQSVMWQRLLPIGLLVINLEVACFVLIMLTDRQPGGAAIAGLVPLQWIVGFTLLGVPALLGIERLIERITGKVPTSDADISSASQTFTVSLRWVLTVIVAGLDVWYVLDFKGTVKGASALLGLTYFGFSIILGVMVSTFAIYERRQLEGSRRRAINFLAISIIAPFSYLVVLAFSYGVFQNIPATRGGGNYVGSPKVVLTFKATQTISALETNYFEKGSSNITIPLILIEESSWAFYLADPNDGGGPAEWKQIGGRKPRIFIANKSEVAKLHSESRNP